MDQKEIHNLVKKRYGKIAGEHRSCCTPSDQVSCCGESSTTDNIGKQLGYSDSDLHSVPEGANLGLGCGNPVAIASLQPGETVLDLGSGAGFDCFLAAQRVGDTGTVIGVDMTEAMVSKAKRNLAQTDHNNIDFRLGHIEELPVEDGTVDVVISNCVINLSPDKPRIFDEIFRVLKPGGRFMISDIVLEKELPDFIRESVDAYVGCVSGAILKEEYLGGLKQAGFSNVKVESETRFPVESVVSSDVAQSFIREAGISMDEIAKIAGTVSSMKVSGYKTPQSGDHRPH